MKKIILSIALMICAVCAVNAQSFNSDSRYIGASVGLGSYGVPVTLYYEQAVHEHIGIGAVLGYAGETENNWKYTNLLIGVRGNYHFLEHIVQGTKWDTYGGLTLGYNIVSSSWKGSGVSDVSASSSAFIFGAQLGARYCFSDAWAAFAEFGCGFGFLSVGATYSF